MPTYLGLRTVVYPAPDLTAAKAWFTALLGREPYFDEPFYVGYRVGPGEAGHELGLDPSADPALGARTYLGVPDAEAAAEHLIAKGAEVVEALHDVGGGIRVACVRAPGGGVVGIIENPHAR